MRSRWASRHRGTSTLGAAMLALALSLLAVVPAWANPRGDQGTGVTNPAILALITNDDAFSTMDLVPVLALAPSTTGSTNGTQHYGPYASTSLDSSTCGNDWAQDSFDRHFTVRQQGPTTYTVVEQFKNGAFKTLAGPSPGACDTDLGGTIIANKNGDMHGYEIITVNGTQTSTDPACVPAINPPPRDAQRPTSLRTTSPARAWSAPTFSTTARETRRSPSMSGRMPPAIVVAIRGTSPPPLE